MDQRLARIGNILKDVTTQDWKVRVEALRELRSSLGEMKLIQLKRIIGNLIKQIGDGRSLVMQEACETAREICKTFGTDPDFSAVADAIVKACLPIVPSSTKVMSEAAKGCLQSVVQGTPRGYQTPLDRFVRGCTDSTKAACSRLECVRLVDSCMNEWDSEWLSRGENPESMETAIRKSLRDADPEVRTAARMTFTTFARLFPEYARKSLREMEPEDRQRFQDLFPSPQAPVPTSTLMNSAIKRTPHHSAVKRAVPPSSVRQPLSSRKPLQTVSLNVATPAPKTSVKPKDEKSVTFVGLGGSALTTAKKTAVKCKVTVRDRVSRAIIDCFGAEDSPAARSRRISAMRDLASIFVGQSEELGLSDFVSGIHAIESCISSMDENVCGAGMDAFGTFILGLQSKEHREADNVRMDMLRNAFPIALKRSVSGVQVLDEAAGRAVDACFELVKRTDLLSTVIQFQRNYRDDSVLPIFIAHQAQWEQKQAQETPRNSLTDVLGEEDSRLEDVVHEAELSEDEKQILVLARDLNDEDAEVRKNAVDALVAFRSRGLAELNVALESTLTAPQLKLLDCFVRRNCSVTAL